jgi:N-acetylmuramoyl-L-alanine amidase
MDAAAERRTDRAVYTVKFYRGDYSARQRAANADQAVCYFEQHFNSTVNRGANYALAVAATNASARSKSWGRWYAARAAEALKIGLGGSDGLLIGGYQGRGNQNLLYTKMPAILGEPCFVSNPSGAAVVVYGEGRELLAKILADSVRQFFPGGGLVAFSVGHKYKTSNPNDRGAVVLGGGWEADYAEKVLLLAARMLS